MRNALRQHKSCCQRDEKSVEPMQQHVMSSPYIDMLAFRPDGTAVREFAQTREKRHSCSPPCLNFPQPLGPKAPQTLVRHPKKPPTLVPRGSRHSKWLFETRFVLQSQSQGRESSEVAHLVWA
jgi:hypothetical protein